jgi:hypothetical protein
MKLKEKQRSALTDTVKKHLPECSDPEYRVWQIEKLGAGQSALLFGKLRDTGKLRSLLASIEKTKKLLQSLSNESRSHIFLALQYHDDVADGEQFFLSVLQRTNGIVGSYLNDNRPDERGRRKLTTTTEHMNWLHVGVAHVCWEGWARDKLKLGQSGQAINDLPPYVNNNAVGSPFGLFVRDVFRASGLIDNDDISLSTVASAIKAIHKLSRKNGND